MSRSLTCILLTVSIGVASTPVTAQSQYRGPKNEVVAPSRLRATVPGAQGTSHPTSRSIFDIEGYARWEFWWEHNRGAFLWPRSSASQYQSCSEELTLERFFGPWARGRMRVIDLPSDEHVEKKILPTLLKGLSLDNEAVKQNALLALGKSGHLDAETHIAPFIRYRNADVQKAAILALGMLPSSSAFYRLARLFVDESASEEIRCWAAVALGLQGDPRSARLLMDRLRRHLPAYVVDHSFEALTESTIFALGLSRKRSAVPFLISVAGRLRAQPTASGRLEAAVLIALGRLEDPSGTPHIARALLDERIPVRRAAALALTGSASEAHQVLLEAALRSDADMQTQGFAAIALARVGTPRAREALIQKLQSGDATSARSFAALGLGILGDPAATQALLPFLQRAHPRSLRAAVSVSLGLLRDSRAVSNLRQLAFDASEHPDLRGYAALGLGLLRDRGSLAKLQARVVDRDEPVEFRRSAISSIGLLGDAGSLPVLLGLLENEGSEMLVAAAAQSLGLIRSEAAVDPLRDMLIGQQHLSGLSMSGATIALGYLADASRLPDLSRIAVGVDYRERRRVIEDLLSLL